MRTANTGYNEALQSMHCKDCDEHMPIRRHSTRNAERMVMLIQAFAIEHKDCWRYESASDARFYMRMKREFRRLGL